MNEEKFIAKNQLLNECVLEKEETPFSKIRSFMLEKFGIWDVLDIFPYSFRMFYYDKIKPIFKPCNKKLRKSIPRTWIDSSELIINLNFQIIKSFYEDEYINGYIDWESTKPHKDFSEWLEKSYYYITKERPQLQIDLENAYPKSKYKLLEDMFLPTVDENGRKLFQFIDDGIPYEVKYAEVNRIEEIIDNKDTDILKQMVVNRHFFWT